MMLTIETQISGTTVGDKLQGDTEELAYALVALADRMPKSLGKEVAEYIYDSDAKEAVRGLLQNLLDGLSS